VCLLPQPVSLCVGCQFAGSLRQFVVLHCPRPAALQPCCRCCHRAPLLGPVLAACCSGPRCLTACFCRLRHNSANSDPLGLLRAAALTSAILCLQPAACPAIIDSVHLLLDLHSNTGSMGSRQHGCCWLFWCNGAGSVQKGCAAVHAVSVAVSSWLAVMRWRRCLPR
jgi:hypothetical protein